MKREGSLLLVCISYLLLSSVGVYLERLIEINGIYTHEPCSNESY